MQQRRIIGERLAGLIEERGWSQAQLSERAGLGKAAVNDLIHNPERTPRRGTIAKLARALGVETSYLMGETDQMIAEGGGLVELDPHSLARGECGQIWAAIAAMIQKEPQRWRAYLQPMARSHRRPAGVSAEHDAVIVDILSEPKTGDMVLVRSPRADGLRYLAEPYLVGLDDCGAVFHEIRSTPGVDIVGKVIHGIIKF